MTQRTFSPLCQANNLWAGENEFNGNSIIKATTRLALPSGAPANNGDIGLDSTTLKFKAGGTVYSVLSGASTRWVPVAPASWSGQGANYLVGSENEFGAYCVTFYPGSDNYIALSFAVPPNVTATAPVICFGFATDGGVAGDVLMELTGRCLSSGDAIDANTHHSSATLFTVATSKVYYHEVTWNGTWDGSDKILGVKLLRNGDDASDTYSQYVAPLLCTMNFEVTA